MAQLPVITDNTASAASQVMTIDSTLSDEITANGHTLKVFEQPLGKLSINYNIAAVVPPTIDLSIQTQANSITLVGDVITVKSRIVQVDADGATVVIAALNPPTIVLDIDGNINTIDDQIIATSVIRDANINN